MLAMTPLRVVLAGAVVTLLSCDPQCAAETVSVTSVCRLTSDAPIEAGSSFTIRALPERSSGTCTVTVNGSELSLAVEGVVCGGAGGAAKRVAPAPVPCQVPALDAGTYTVAGTSNSFSVPQTGGTVLPACP